MVSSNAPFFHPYVQMELGYLLTAAQCVRINYRPPATPPHPAKLKIHRGNGLFHANEIEYVSQYNCENRVVLDWCPRWIEVPTESGFLLMLGYFFPSLFDLCSLMAQQIRLYSLWRSPDGLKCFGYCEWNSDSDQLEKWYLNTIFG